jgi:hypothetical protein
MITSDNVTNSLNLFTLVEMGNKYMYQTNRICSSYVFEEVRFVTHILSFNSIVYGAFRTKFCKKTHTLASPYLSVCPFVHSHLTT